MISASKPEYAENKLSELIPVEVIKTAFMRLSAIYLSKWTNQFPTPESRQLTIVEWHDALKRFTQNHINYALSACRKAYKSWPPTLGEFEDLCDEYQYQMSTEKLLQIGHDEKQMTGEEADEITARNYARNPQIGMFVRLISSRDVKFTHVNLHCAIKFKRAKNFINCDND
jgi:hypothetical protein